MCTFIKKPIHWESVQAPSTITTFPRTSVSWWRAVGKQGGGKGREKIHEQCRTDKTGEDKRRDSQEVQHISWLLLGRQQPCAHTHTHTPSCGGGFGCLCTRTFFQWWPMGHMKPSSNDSMPTSSTFSSSWRAQGHSKLASLSAHLPMHSPLASTSAHACEFYPCVTCNCM